MCPEVCDACSHFTGPGKAAEDESSQGGGAGGSQAGPGLGHAVPAVLSTPALPTSPALPSAFITSFMGGALDCGVPRGLPSSSLQ